MSRHLQPIFSGILLFIICLAYSTNGTARYFDNLGKLPEYNAKVEAEKIYDTNIYLLDSARAVQVLLAEGQQAAARKDYLLQTLISGFIGKYYLNEIHNGAAIALPYYNKALQLASEYQYRLLKICYTQQVGTCYYNMGKYPQAFEYLLQANEMAQQTGYGRLPAPDQFLYEMGYIYHDFQEYRKSIVFLREARTYLPQTPQKLHIMINNTLALDYLNLSNHDSAEYFFNQALQSASDSKDTAWIGIIYGNLGQIAMHRNQFDKAWDLTHKDYAISLRYNQLRSAAGCLISIGHVLLYQDKLDEAQQKLDSARLLLRKDNDLLKYQSLYLNLARLSAKKHNMGLAYAYLDSFISYKDSFAHHTDAKMLAQEEGKIETEKHLATLKLLEIEKSRQLLIRNFIVIALALVVIITVQVIRKQRFRQRKDREIFAIEKKRADEEIRNAELQLAAYTENLREKSNLIEQFKDEILQLQAHPDSPASQEQQEIVEKLHYATILTDEDWINFKNMFIKVHKDFFVKLQEKYPDLTQAETRFLALTKLAFSVNEMANTLGISPDSVRKTRLRLRKKLSLPEHAILEDLV